VHHDAGTGIKNNGPGQVRAGIVHRGGTPQQNGLGSAVRPVHRDATLPRRQQRRK
jgi:hypothetical protein